MTKVIVISLSLSRKISCCLQTARAILRRQVKVKNKGTFKVAEAEATLHSNTATAVAWRLEAEFTRPFPPDRFPARKYQKTLAF